MAKHRRKPKSRAARPLTAAQKRARNAGVFCVVTATSHGEGRVVGCYTSKKKAQAVAQKQRGKARARKCPPTFWYDGTKRKASPTTCAKRLRTIVSAGNANRRFVRS